MCSTNHSAAVWSETSSFWMLMEGIVSKSCTLCIVLELKQNSCPTCLLWSQWWGKGGCESRALTDYPAWRWATSWRWPQSLPDRGEVVTRKAGWTIRVLSLSAWFRGIAVGSDLGCSTKCKFVPHCMALEWGALSWSTLEKDTRGINSCSLKGSNMYISRGSLSGLFLALLKLQ